VRGGNFLVMGIGSGSDVPPIPNPTPFLISTNDHVVAVDSIRRSGMNQMSATAI
jgi:hypothetical protein